MTAVKYLDQPPAGWVRARDLAEISYFDEEWMFEGETPTLIATLVEALGNLAVAGPV